MYVTLLVQYINKSHTLNHHSTQCHWRCSLGHAPRKFSWGQLWRILKANSSYDVALSLMVLIQFLILTFQEIIALNYNSRRVNFLTTSSCTDHRRLVWKERNEKWRCDVNDRIICVGWMGCSNCVFFLCLLADHLWSECHRQRACKADHGLEKVHSGLSVNLSVIVPFVYLTTV